MSQKVDSDSAPTFTDLLTPVVPFSRYTIFEESDASHAGAKRYSFKAVVNGSVSKTEVYSIVRQLTNDGAKSTYHRNHLSQGRWGDSEAKVVWTFVYASANDYARGNPICRSLWIDPDLPEQHRPLALSGENIGDHIYVAWNSMYLELARHVATNTSTKSEYLGRIVPLSCEISVKWTQSFGQESRLVKLESSTPIHCQAGTSSGVRLTSDWCTWFLPSSNIWAGVL